MWACRSEGHCSGEITERQPNQYKSVRGVCVTISNYAASCKRYAVTVRR